MANQTKNGPSFCHFQGFCCRPNFIPNIISFQKHFQAQDNDIIAVSHPKAGTTWLKALVFTIVNRSRYTLSDNPLNTTNPHDLVPYFELVLYANGQIPDLTTLPSPRLFSTHIPYSVLSKSIKQANTRIVYVTRNPLDVIVSYWYFMRNKPSFADWPWKECFEMFCQGEGDFGPFWDHVLGYWKGSLNKPNEVLFIRYEDLKENPNPQIKKVAEFIGFPFSVEEERAGVVEEIAKFCSFSNLKDLASQKTKELEWTELQNIDFYRRGQVGDYINHLTPSEIERFTKILQEKLDGSGLVFGFDCTT